MNEKEKLSELMHSADLAFMAKGIEIIENAMNEDLIEKIISRQEFIAEYLLANGVIVPPCKVGQTVYCIRYDIKRKPFIKPLEVLTITIYANGRFTVFTTKEDIWGKTVFLSKEDAEKALKMVE